MFSFKSPTIEPYWDDKDQFGLDDHSVHIASYYYRIIIHI